MKYFTGIDVSLRSVSICVVDAAITLTVLLSVTLHGLSAAPLAAA